MPYAPLSTSPAPAPAPAPAPVAASKGYVSLSSGSPAPAPATPAPVGSGYQPITSVGLKTPAAPAPTQAAAPVSTPSGNSALDGTLGGGYGASNITDPSSGKPLLTYENQSAKSSQLLSDRTAPSFDPTKIQPITKDMLTNGRMPESVSQAIKAQFPGSTADELDHIMPLELGGSNNKSNLRLEAGTNPNEPYSPSKNPTATDPIENQLADAVYGGQMSLVDAWKQMAQAKNITLPEQGGPLPSSKNIQQSTPAQSPLSKVTGFFSSIFSKAANAIGGLAEKTLPVQIEAAIQAKGVKGGLQDIAARTENQILSGQARLNTDKSGKKEFFPGNIAQSAIGAELGGPEEVFSDPILDSIAKETDPAKISTTLQSKGIAPDTADSVAPVLARTTTQAQVKAVLQAAADNGLLYAEEGKDLAGEFEKQTGPAPEETKALPAPAEETPIDRTPTVNLDEQARNEAATKTVAGKGSGVNGLDADTQQIYRDWVNQSGESNKAISGEIAAKPFEPLRAQGMDAVHAFQNGDRTGQLANVDTFGKDILAKEQAAGIPVEAKKNYLPQYWANSQAEIEKAQAKYAGDNPGKSISLKPGFSKESIFPDYAAGEKYGLTPKYNNIPDMINARVQASEKALADRTFFEQAAKKGLAIPASHAGEGWDTVPRFPQYPIKGSDGRTYTGLTAMPKPLADLVNNHLNPPEGTLNRVLQKTANAATALKQVVLTSGIFPKTAINLHGFNELANTVPEVFNHPTLFFNALKYMLYPKSAENFIQANLARAKEAALDGVQLGGEEKTINNLVGAFDPNGKLGKAGVLVNKTRQALYNNFAKPLFEQMIPALKLQMHFAEKDAMVAKGMAPKAAGKIAASRTNNTFGGMNLAELGRDKNLQNFLKTFTLAPDFWEARYRYVGNAAKGLFGKGDAANLYRNAAITIGGAYLAMTIANKAKTGHWMFENPAGHSMDVLLGQDSKGKNIWFRPFGTTLDLLRLPMDLAQSIIQNGDVSGISTDIRDRVSALVQPIASLTYNTDAFGNKIFQPATPSDPLTKQIGAFVATLPIIPTNVAGLSELANPSQSKEQSISQAAGAPLRFNSATPSSVSDLANLIYSERTTLETQIKKEYASGDSKDALDQMAQYNAALLEDTINAYEAQGHKVTDKQAFTNWLISTDQKNGGIKDLVIKPPTDKSISATKAKQGQPLFNKIFPSNITP